jgi:putative transposase
MDLGVNYAVVLSDGTVVPNPRPYQQAQERLAALQRRWDRIKHRPTDDPEKRALRRAIARQHRRIGDRRDNFEQQTSRQLADAYCILHAEDLNIPGLAQGDLSKQVHDVAWGRLLALTDRKAAKAGGRLHRWDPRGSSQACLCGARVPKGRGDRVHRCPACGLELDRDWVSALVMRERGRAALARATSS